MGMDMNKLLGEMQQMQSRWRRRRRSSRARPSRPRRRRPGHRQGDWSPEIVEITIDPKAIDPDDPELLADMIQAAANEAIRSAQALMEQRLGGLAATGKPRARPPDLNFGPGPALGRLRRTAVVPPPRGEINWERATSARHGVRFPHRARRSQVRARRERSKMRSRKRVSALVALAAGIVAALKTTPSAFGWTVDMTAQTSLKRTYQWKIEKSVTPTSVTLNAGETATVAYSVTVTNTAPPTPTWA